LFAIQRELAATREVTLELPAGASVADAWAALEARYPVLAPGRPSVRFAVNGEYAGPDTPLADGDEVAMIPPVSGGSSEAGPHHILELRSEPLGADILGELARRLAIPQDGAVVGFLGVTRATPGTPAPGQEAEADRHLGRAVEALDYEALEPMALRLLAEIAGEVRDRFGVERLAIVHRVGSVPLGDASVAIVACAPHRAAAFRAASYAIDETKARAPIWKAEHFADGHVWIGEPARDGPRPG
jgi:molybdopterin synthase catalytic subunit